MLRACREKGDIGALFDALSVVGQFGYSIRASSLPNYAYDNLYGTLAIAWRF